MQKTPQQPPSKPSTGLFLLCILSFVLFQTERAAVQVFWPGASALPVGALAIEEEAQ